MHVSTTHSLPILIVGGGIGGAATALALANKGFRSHVLEQAEDFREVGAGIQMPPNAFKVFRQLGVVDAMSAVAAFPENLIHMDMLTGRPIIRVPVGDEFVSRFEFPYSVMHRGDLLECLLDACRASGMVRLQTSARVSSFSEHDGRVSVFLEGGEAIEGAALIAAEGLWSKIREELLQDGPPRTDGYVVYRGVLPRSDLPDHLYSNSVTMWGGPDLDLSHYPLRRGEVFNIAACYRDPNFKAGQPYPSGDRETLRHYYRDTCDKTREYVDIVDAERTWVIYDRVPVKHWHRGLVALLGDAAHPAYNYIAQGACMALEDAITLAAEFARADTVEAAFHAYVNRRYLRTARVQLVSRQFGEIYHASAVNRELRNQLLSDAPPRILLDTLAWVFNGVDPEARPDTIEYAA